MKRNILAIFFLLPFSAFASTPVVTVTESNNCFTVINPDYPAENVELMYSIQGAQYFATYSTFTAFGLFYESSYTQCIDGGMGQVIPFSALGFQTGDRIYFGDVNTGSHLTSTYEWNGTTFDLVPNIPIINSFIQSTASSTFAFVSDVLEKNLFDVLIIALMITFILWSQAILKGYMK